jgi:hypothetical protein
LIGWVSGGALKISVERFPLDDVARAHAAISDRPHDR